jgi:two-component system, chemotaxis family, protein-glutamate methylesterase/glutaminase
VNHDIVAIGGSAGAVDVLLDLVPELPAQLAAAIFVVVHSAANRESTLPALLASRGRLPAIHPLHGERIEPGRIYVAPPDNHLLVRVGSVEVVRGPKENGNRPAVDALFRTAANAYGSRVVGVVLSGYLDCGTAGALSIKARGGVVVAQSPETAVAPPMPQSVINHVQVDHVVHPLELPKLLVRLVGAAAKAGQPAPGFLSAIEGVTLGAPAELVCPLCQGVLTEAQVGSFDYFRCHVGHAFSLESLVNEHSDEMERALWAAARALDEGAALSRRLARQEKGDLAARFAEKAATQAGQAETIRHMVLYGRRLTPEDSKDV